VYMKDDFVNMRALIGGVAELMASYHIIFSYERFSLRSWLDWCWLSIEEIGAEFLWDLEGGV
jgi:hypothetical protein